MLDTQRALFDMPREICYLNAASYSPLPKAVQEVGHAGVGRKGQPWTVPADMAAQQFDRARRAAAALINADPADIALISSISYGVAAAAKGLAVPRGTRVLTLADDHTSPVLEWMSRAAAQGFSVESVAAPDGDWTAALLAAIERPGAPPVGLASFASVHWTDGGAVDLERVAAALRRQGAALLIDATHGTGAIPIDVKTLDPDFLVFPTYKWLLGPYGRAFLYVAKRRQEAVPLEQTSYGRREIVVDKAPSHRDLGYVSGARRFDMGERDWFVSLEMASVGMELMAGWGAAAVGERLGALTRRLAEGLADNRTTVLPERLRAPHILSLGFPQGMPDKLLERLAAERVYAAPRLGRLRLGPHVYNDEADVDRFIQVFRQVTR